MEYDFFGRARENFGYWMLGVSLGLAAFLAWGVYPLIEAALYNQEFAGIPTGVIYLLDGAGLIRDAWWAFGLAVAGILWVLTRETVRPVAERLALALSVVLFGWATISCVVAVWAAGLPQGQLP
jgi:hypothetical protein